MCEATRCKTPIKESPPPPKTPSPYFTHNDFILMVSFLKKIRNKNNTTKEKIAG